jgi:hypothetical protein
MKATIIILMGDIIDYKRDVAMAVPIEDKYLTTRSGQRKLRKTTQGWSSLVNWKGGTESWVELAELKDSYPIELAEFAKVRGIPAEPAFVWWIPHTLGRRNAIHSAVKARVRKKTHKYGIEVPTSLVRAKELDRINGNTLWIDALKLEMHNVGVAFEVLEDGKSAQQGWKKASGHIIWDLKMGFSSKTRWALDGHKLPTPEESTYAGVVSRESVKITMTYAALNGLEVCAVDIRNAYLQPLPLVKFPSYVALNLVWRMKARWL